MRIHILAPIGVALALLGLSAAAEAKPRIAILGLEVVDEGSLDAETTRAAERLTAELRRAARADRSPFELAPGGDKDLLELKLLSDCSDEARECMARIGRELDADQLLYGSVEKRNDGYQVSLRLLDTESEELQRSGSEFILAEELDSENAGGWGRKLYDRVAGAAEEATLVVITNAERGSLWIDDGPATALRGGRALVSGLSEGVHRIAVEAPNYERYEAEVALEAGASQEIAITLSAVRADPLREVDGGETTDGEEGTGWRTAFWGGVAATAALSAGWGYNGLRARGSLDDRKDERFRALADAEIEDIASYSRDTQRTTDENGATRIVIGDACSASRSYRDASSPVSAAVTQYVDACERGERAALYSNLFLGAAVASAVVTGYLGFRAFSSEEGSSESGRSRVGKLQLFPAIGPESIGAGMSLTF